MGRTTIIAALLALCMGALAGCSGLRFGGGGPGEITYAVLPHPDDEFQVWSQVQDREDSFTVFVLLTRGEASYFCDSPVGGGTPESCAEARLDSWLAYFDHVVGQDSTLPGEFPAEPDVVRYGAEADHFDPELSSRSAAYAGRDVLVWQDKDQRGALVAFDLGDGKLTQEDVVWAIDELRGDPTKFGLPKASLDRVVGSYFYDGDDPACFHYPHNDHEAVAMAIQNEEMAPEQMFATCASYAKSGEISNSSVSQEAAASAFGSDTSDGAFQLHYYWLGNWTLGETDQTQIFHIPQSFWIKVSP